MKELKDFVFTVRLPRNMGADLDKLCIATYTDRPTLIRAALGAVMEFYKTNGSISLPLMIVPKRRTKAGKVKDAA